MSNSVQPTVSVIPNIVVRPPASTESSRVGRYSLGFDLSTSDNTRDRVLLFLLNDAGEILAQGTDTATLRLNYGTLGSNGLYTNATVDVVTKGAREALSIMVLRRTIPASGLDVTSLDAEDAVSAINLSVDRVFRTLQEVNDRLSRMPSVIHSDGRSATHDGRPLVTKAGNVLATDNSGNVVVATLEQVFKEFHPEIVAANVTESEFQFATSPNDTEDTKVAAAQSNQQDAILLPASGGNPARRVHRLGHKKGDYVGVYYIDDLEDFPETELFKCVKTTIDIPVGNPDAPADKAVTFIDARNAIVAKEVAELPYLRTPSQGKLKVNIAGTFGTETLDNEVTLDLAEIWARAAIPTRVTIDSFDVTFNVRFRLNSSDPVNLASSLTFTPSVANTGNVDFTFEWDTRPHEVQNVAQIVLKKSGEFNIHIHKDIVVDSASLTSTEKGELAFLPQLHRVSNNEVFDLGRTLFIEKSITAADSIDWLIDKSTGYIQAKAGDYITFHLEWENTADGEETVTFRITPPIKDSEIGRTVVHDERILIAFREVITGAIPPYPKSDWEEASRDSDTYIRNKPTEVKPHNASGNKPTDITLAEDSVTSREVAENTMGYDEIEDGIVTQIRQAVNWDNTAISGDKQSIILAKKDSAGDVEEKKLPFPIASEGQRGVVQLADQSEVNSATDDAKAVTALKLKGNLDTVFPSKKRIPDFSNAEAGEIVTVNSQGTGLEFQSPEEASVDNATTDVRGVAELATQAEVDAPDNATNGDKIVTPVTLKGNLDKVFPAKRRIPNFAQGDAGQVVKVNATGDALEIAPERRIATEQEAEDGTDNSTVMTPLRTKQSINLNRIASGDELPSNPHVGERYKLLTEDTFHNDLVEYGLSTPTTVQYDFRNPPANGPHSIVAYSDGHGGVVNNNVYLVWNGSGSPGTPASAGPPAVEAVPAQVLLYREGGQRVWLNVSTTSEVGLAHWYQIMGITFGDVDDTGYRFGINYRESAQSAPLYADSTVKPGDYTYAGASATDAIHGWVKTPGIGLDRQQVLDLIRQNTNTEAITQLINGPGAGLAIVGTNTANYSQPSTAQISFTTNIDLDDPDDRATGVIEIEASLSITTRSNTNLGFTAGGGGSPPTAVIQGFTFASTVKDSTAFAAATSFGQDIGMAPIYSGQTHIGNVILAISKDSNDILGYNLRYVPLSRQGSANADINISTNVRAAFIHQQGGGNVEEVTLFSEELILASDNTSDGTFMTLSGLTVGKRYLLTGSFVARSSGNDWHIATKIYNHSTSFIDATILYSKLFYGRFNWATDSDSYGIVFTAAHTTITVRSDTRISGQTSRILGAGSKGTTYMVVQELPTKSVVT